MFEASSSLVTIDTIKRHATRIKKSTSIPHHQALNEAAIHAGFQNFKHAQNELANTPTMALGYELILSAYWHDNKEGLRGKESLSINLSSPWDSLIRLNHLDNTGRLRGFGLETENHLSANMFRSQSGARSRVLTAARTFQFINATGLKPSARGFSRAYPNKSTSIQDSRKIPGEDHISIWFDDNRRYLIVDEPYEASVPAYEEKRQIWLDQHDYVMSKPIWPGMYNPDGGSRLYLITSKTKGVNLSQITEQLNKIPTIRAGESYWSGKSIVSPAFSYTSALENKMDLRLHEALEHHFHHGRSNITIDELAAGLSCFEDQFSLRAKLRKIDAENSTAKGMTVKINGETLQLYKSA